VTDLVFLSGAGIHQEDVWILLEPTGRLAGIEEVVFEKELVSDLLGMGVERPPIVKGFYLGIGLRIFGHEGLPSNLRNCL
jgi:hypothetical protein